MLKLSGDETAAADTAAQAEDITTSQGYFDLMNLMDATGKKIDYNKMVYTSEIDGLAKRRKSLKDNFVYNLVFLIVLFIFDIFYANLMFGQASVMLQAAETWIAIGALCVATLYMIYRVIRAYIIYKVNVISGFMEDYLIKHDIHTMVEEEEYCRKILRRMLDYEATVSRLSKTVRTDSDIQAAMDEISRMNFDIKEFHYNAGRSNK